MRVGYDCDGVLHCFKSGLCDYLEFLNDPKWHIPRTIGDSGSWTFYRDAGWTDADFKRICDDAADAGFLFNGNVRSSAQYAVQMTYVDGHTNVMITDRQFGKTPEVSHNRTFDWIIGNGFHFDEVHFSADKTIVPCDTFVEDKIENYEALEAAGTMVWLIDRPWNRFKPVKNRIKDIGQYPGLVRQYSRERFAPVLDEGETPFVI